MVKVKKYIAILSVTFMTGCVADFNRDKTSEEALLALGDYNKLIINHRERLAQNENRKDRYKLALYYNMAADYKASSYYLKPLMSDNPTSKECYLEAKNLNALGIYQQTLDRLKCAVSRTPVVNEAYNLFGVVYATNGEYALAVDNLNIARDKFVDEVTVMNNLAMVALMQDNYTLARDYLYPLYARGILNDKGMYNLAFTYVKMNDPVMTDAILNSLRIEDKDKSKVLSEMKSTMVINRQKSG